LKIKKYAQQHFTFSITSYYGKKVVVFLLHELSTITTIANHHQVIIIIIILFIIIIENISATTYTPIQQWEQTKHIQIKLTQTIKSNENILHLIYTIEEQ
jgi:hypothetical protein